jgi:Rod binding domain-containing protein
VMPIHHAMTEPNLVRLRGAAGQPAMIASQSGQAVSSFARLFATQQPAEQHANQQAAPHAIVSKEAPSPELEAAFTDFVGQTFYGQMLHAMRSSVGKPAYVHGGQAEEIFQSQLDQVLAEKMSDQTGAQFAKPMFARQFS